MFHWTAWEDPAIPEFVIGTPAEEAWHDRNAKKRKDFYDEQTKFHNALLEAESGIYDSLDKIEDEETFEVNAILAEVEKPKRPSRTERLADKDLGTARELRDRIAGADEIDYEELEKACERVARLEREEDEKIKQKKCKRFGRGNK